MLEAPNLNCITLERAITRFLADLNDHAQTFVWTKPTRQIKRSIRNAAFIYETQH